MKGETGVDVSQLSESYQVRRLQEGDVEQIFALCASNPLFYRYHPPFVTKESILEDMEALPLNKSKEDKLYIGFFTGGRLAAVMDLILHYPRSGVAFIGFFMTGKDLQGRGMGSRIIDSCAACLTRWGFHRLRLAIDEGNPQSEGFWTKNHFSKTGERVERDLGAYILMERALPSPSPAQEEGPI